MEQFVMDLGTMMDDDLVMNVHLLLQNNMSIISLVKMNGGKSRMKYMKVRKEYISERLGTSELEIEYISTSKMLADVLTKPLGGSAYHNLVETLLGGHKFRDLSNKGAMNESAT